MCGIAGIFSFRGKEFDRKVLLNLQQSLRHRGPDDEGIFSSSDLKMHFVHTRLSIIDLTSSGHQPMANRDETVWITYNGEIYNYVQLREDLKNQGCSFVSSSDTEVIIRGYEVWGIEELLKRLRGMFAFALYDTRGPLPRLILARK